MEAKRITGEQVQAVLAALERLSGRIDESGEIGGLYIHTDVAVRAWLRRLGQGESAELLAMINGAATTGPPPAVDAGLGAKGIDGIEEGQLVEVVLRGYASNVDHDGKQGPRLTVGAKADGTSMSNGIYARDGHVVSVGASVESRQND